MQHVCVHLDEVEVFRKSLAIGSAFFEGMQHNGIVTAFPAAAHPECNLRDGAYLARIPHRLDRPGQFKHRSLPHPVAEVIGRTPCQDGRKQLILPIVVVGKTPERGLDSTDDDRDIGIEFLENLRIYADGIIRPLSRLPFRGVGIVMTEPFPGGVVIDHRVHRAGIDTEIEPRSAEFPEVAQVVAPIGLWNDGHPVAEMLEIAGYAGCTEGRMVHKCVTCKQDHIDVVPSQCLNFPDGSRKHVIQVPQVHDYPLLCRFAACKT